MRRIKWTTMGMAAVAGLLVACMANDNHPVAPTIVSTTPMPAGAGTRGSVGDRSLLGGLLGGSAPPQYFACTGNGGPYSGSAVIGPLGGRVVFGPHELDVPPLAVLKPTTISARTLPGDTIAVNFQPQGLQFIVPAALQLSYGQCTNRPTTALSIVYVTNLLDQLLAVVESLDATEQHKVIGPINHFSVYAVAERR